MVRPSGKWSSLSEVGRGAVEKLAFRATGDADLVEVHSCFSSWLLHKAVCENLGCARCDGR
jgi:hypothetical protein